MNTQTHAPTIAPEPAPDPLYKMVDPDLMKRIMRRTGTGASMSIRDLSFAAGVPRSTVHKVLSGAEMTVQAQTAHRLAHTIGVDVLVLFVPIGRAVTDTDEQRPAVSA